MLNRENNEIFHSQLGKSVNKTIFEITKMDCPSEENLIRMKLEPFSNIKNLSFNIPNRKLTVFHDGELKPIEHAIEELNLGGKLLTTKISELVETS